MGKPSNTQPICGGCASTYCTHADTQTERERAERGCHIEVMLLHGACALWGVAGRLRWCQSFEVRTE